MDTADAYTPHDSGQTTDDTVKPPPMAMRLGDALADAADRLAGSGVEAPRREARLLAAHVLGLPPSALLDPARSIDPVAFRSAVSRRAAREPLAFITGRRGFWTLDIAVSPDTLVPRADSETLIEASLAAFPEKSMVRRILDLGTGTGCLLLAAMTEFFHATGVGADLSPESAALARRNAAACGQGGRASFVAGNWADSLDGRFDLILCNPPYIESAAIAALMPEVSSHEPARALDGGHNGLSAYRAIVPALPRLLSSIGAAVLEVGQGQGDAVTRIAAEAGLICVDLRQDLGGVPRALVLRSAACP